MTDTIPEDLAVGADDAIVVSGRMTKPTAFGSGLIFLAKYSSLGAFRWARTFADVAASASISEVAVDASGSIAVTGAAPSS